jgi:hypothetical protein
VGEHDDEHGHAAEPVELRPVDTLPLGHHLPSIDQFRPMLRLAPTPLASRATGTLCTNRVRKLSKTASDLRPARACKALYRGSIPLAASEPLTCI